MNADPVQLNSAIEAQILQMQIMADQYTKLQKSCELKCINENYRNGLLTKTEAVCIDNCVKKYLEFNHHVTIHLRELQEPQTLMQFEMQQQELGGQMGL